MMPNLLRHAPRQSAGLSTMLRPVPHEKFEGIVVPAAGASGKTGQWIVRHLQAHSIDYPLFARS